LVGNGNDLTVTSKERKRKFEGRASVIFAQKNFS
jgi:hypothetical protein